MSNTRNQHFVFQGYLRGFAKYKPGQEKRAKVHVIDLQTKKSYPTNVRNVGAVRDFNRIETNDHDPNVLEDHLGRFESDAAAAIRKVANILKFEGDDRNTILNVAALFATRHPVMRSSITAAIDNTHRKTASIITASKDRYESIIRRMQQDNPDNSYLDVSYETMKDFVDRGQFDIVPNQNFLIDLELKNMDRLLPILGQRSWSLTVADKDAGDFVTCDHPLNLVRTDGRQSPAGHGLKNTMVMLPLTRKVMLTGEFGEPERVLVADKQIVAAFNSMTINQTMSQVYAFNDGFFYSKRRVLYQGRNLHLDPEATQEVPKVEMKRPTRRSKT